MPSHSFLPRWCSLLSALREGSNRKITVGQHPTRPPPWHTGRTPTSRERICSAASWIDISGAMTSTYSIIIRLSCIFSISCSLVGSTQCSHPAAFWIEIRRANHLKIASGEGPISRDRLFPSSPFSQADTGRRLLPPSRFEIFTTAEHSRSSRRRKTRGRISGYRRFSTHCDFNSALDCKVNREASELSLRSQNARRRET